MLKKRAQLTIEITHLVSNNFRPKTFLDQQFWTKTFLEKKNWTQNFVLDQYLTESVLNNVKGY